MSTVGIAAVALALLLGTASASASARVAIETYDPQRIFEVAASPGFATMIELEKGEAIDNVVVGDSDGWDVTSTGRGDQLVVKPRAGASTTDMIVTSDRRRYTFLLTTQSAAGPTYVLQFNYAGAVQPPSKSPRDNQFTFRGASTLFPVEMRQNGSSTVIRWAPQSPIPAVFAVRDDGTEILANGRMDGDNYIVDAVASKFAFRLGSDQSIAVKNSRRGR